MTPYIPELKRLIKAASLTQAREMLSNLAGQPDADKTAVIEILALAPDKAALDLLTFLMDMTGLDSQTRERLFHLVTDRAHLNYDFARILLAACKPDQIRSIIPLLKHILAKETKGEILNLILRAAGKHNLAPLVEDVAEFIFYDDKDLKQEAVKALERMATPEALDCLRRVAATDKCDQDVLDAVEMLERLVPAPDAGQPQDRQEPATEMTAPAARNLPDSSSDQTDLLRNAPSPEDVKEQDPLTLLASDRLDDRFTAYMSLSQQGDRVAQALHDNLDTHNPDLMVNLLRLIQRTIPSKSLADLLTLTGKKDLDKPVRFALYNALAAFPKLESAAGILKGATDPAMYIRLAAVNALDRHYSDYILAEIKNKIESGTKTGEALAVSILDARASRLIDALMNSDTFSYICSNYLERSAPVQVIDAYISVLEARNRRSTLKKYTRLRLERTDPNCPAIVVIHPSQTFLAAYTKLIAGCGFTAKTFSGPQEAFESIVFEKPAAVVCDLFLTNISALDLAREVRELYPMEEVPIVVSSLQRHLDKAVLASQFENAGINTFCEFPAKPGQIKSWITSG